MLYIYDVVLLKFIYCMTPLFYLDKIVCNYLLVICHNFKRIIGQIFYISAYVLFIVA